MIVLFLLICLSYSVERYIVSASNKVEIIEDFKHYFPEEDTIYRVDFYAWAQYPIVLKVIHDNITLDFEWSGIPNPHDGFCKYLGTIKLEHNPKSRKFVISTKREEEFVVNLVWECYDNEKLLIDVLKWIGIVTGIIVGVVIVVGILVIQICFIFKCGYNAGKKIVVINGEKEPLVKK